MITVGWIVLMLLIAGGMISMHMRWVKEMLICWVLLVLLLLWLAPATIAA